MKRARNRAKRAERPVTHGGYVPRDEIDPSLLAAIFKEEPEARDAAPSQQE